MLKKYKIKGRKGFKGNMISKSRIQGFKGSRGQAKTLKAKHSNPQTLEPLNPLGMTFIEVILVMLIIGILAAVVIPKLNIDLSSRASVEGAAHMIASDIRYVQECAMANRVSKSITFTLEQSFYEFPVTIPSTSALDPSGRLPSGVTITSPTYTLQFNSLGEPISIPPETQYVDVTISGGKTIRIYNFTGKVSIL